MKTILVPTDLSDTANNAAEYAVKLAEKIKAQVVLFHAYHFYAPPMEAAVIIPSSEVLQKEKETILQKNAEKLRKNTTVQISYSVKMGMATDEILEEEKNVDLIIMGMRTVGKLSEYLLGSITTAVISKTAKPVIIVPEGIKFKVPKKIAFACDYNPGANYETIGSLNELIKVFGSELLVLNIKPKLEPVSVEEAGAGLRLEKKLNEINHEYHFSENNDLVDGINIFVTEKKADMLAVIPHRHNLLERLFRKSISRSIAFHTSVPMIALPDDHKRVAAYFV